MRADRSRLIRIILLICAIAAALTAGILLAVDAKASQQSSRKLEKVRKTYEEGIEQSAVSDKRVDIIVDVNEQSAACLQLKSLQQKNSELAAWIRIPGTSIDHPVMLREGDSEFYLSHGFDKKEDKNGLLALDGRENSDLTSDLIIINGHNLRSGNMFGALKDYLDYGFACDHDSIELDTVSEKQLYKVFAVVITDAEGETDGFSYYGSIDFADSACFDSFVDRAVSDSVHKLGTAIYGTKLLMLSTCEYSRDDGRLLVLARKVN